MAGVELCNLSKHFLLGERIISAVQSVTTTISHGSFTVIVGGWHCLFSTALTNVVVFAASAAAKLASTAISSLPSWPPPQPASNEETSAKIDTNLQFTQNSLRC